MLIRPAPWITALFLAISAPSGLASEATREELNKLRDQIDRLSDVLDRERAELSTLHDELARVERAMGVLNHRIHETQVDIRSKTGRIKESESEISGIDAELTDRRRQLKNLIVATYASGRAEYLKLLLNQEDPAGLGRLLAYYRYFSDSRVSEIKSFESTVDRLQRVKSGLLEEKSELEALEKAQQSQREDLSAARGQRRSVVAALESGINTGEQHLAVMKQDENRLAHLLQDIGKASAAVPSSGGAGARFGQMRGRLSLPLKGRISALFGQTRRDTDIPWQGIFMDAAEGTAVSAIYSGRVVFADWLRGFGLLLILDHGDGFMSLYSHNQLLFRQVGEWVEMGESIALVGSSGGQSNTGLYFEVRKNGEPLNPLIWCKVE